MAAKKQSDDVAHGARDKANDKGPRAVRTRTGRIAIVGRPNVGKSTLINALLGEPIAITSRHPQTTRDQILGVITEGDTQLVFVDTPGVHKAKTKLGARMNDLARDAARDADAVLFMVEVGPTSRTSMSEDDVAILESIPAHIPTLLVLNKVDRIKQKQKLFPILEGYAKARDFRAVIPVSALNANGTHRILSELHAMVPEGPKMFDDDALSDRPVRFFVAEFVREQILRKTFQEVPHGVAVVVERFDETQEIPRIDLAIHVDRDSHKRILIGAKGSMLKEIGTEARAKVEQMIGKHVHLQLWVRVTPGWYENDAALREMGYGNSGTSSTGKATKDGR
jgi:GTP-binding protein Era